MLTRRVLSIIQPQGCMYKQTRVTRTYFYNFFRFASSDEIIQSLRIARIKLSVVKMETCLFNNAIGVFTLKFVRTRNSLQKIKILNAIK